jgi:Trypsin-like peptidase domain
MPRHNSASDTGQMIEIYAQFESRIALIRLDGDESGTGFLVAEKLLLTAQHVVEASAGKIADPHSIEVTFDFKHQPHTTSAETGDTVPVVEVVHHSPPTDKERSATRGVDWEASDQYLDYAILQLQRRSLIWSHGQFRPRGHYQIPFTSPRIAPEQVLLLGHHPLGETIKSSFLTFPELNKNKTRIKYQADTMRGSSGGAIVNNNGRLVGLHHYASSTDKHGVPIAAVARDLKACKFDYLVEQTPPEQNVTHLGRYSTNAKRQICEALVNDWRSLTKHLGVPDFVTSADALWDWLSLNNKLRKLRDGLEAAQRAELVRILDQDVIIVDQSAIDNIQDLADMLVVSAESAAAPSAYLRSAMRARSLARMLLDEIESLSSAPDDDRAQLHWHTTWRSELGCAASNLNWLLHLLPDTAEDASFAHSHLQGMLRTARDVQSTVSTLAELGQNPKLSAR